MRPFSFPLAAVLAALAAGCQPDIGDACTLPSDCSTTGDRICDTTFSPEGYCTIFNCEPGGCPEEAVCVSYKGVTSGVEGCQDGQRLERTFCMKACESRDDCRTEDGFTCVDLSEDNAWSATVVERSASRRKICAIPYSGELIPEDRSNDVCSGTSTGELPERLPRDASPPADGGGDGAVSVADGAPPDASPDALFTDGAVSDGAVSDGAVSDGAVSDGPFTDGLADAPAD